MAQLWVRVWRKQRIVANLLLPMDQAVTPVLEEACRQLDIPRPLWLGKNEREYARFLRTTFIQEHFMESVAFDKLEIERLDPETPRPASQDPRIEA